MTVRSDSYIKKAIISLLILSGLAVSVYSQDKQISGIVNVYRRVEAFGPGFDKVTLNRVDSIAKFDTVLLIQMQGVGIVTDQYDYGKVVFSKFGEPGGYEFLIVDTVYSDGTRKVGFKKNILNTFDLKGNVQLVRVPYYNSATVSSKLTARSWDATQAVGGVVAMIVGRKLRLNADIDVSGEGFIGGKDTLGLGECVTDGVNNNHDSYPRTWTNAGYKGEGLALHDRFGVPLASLHAKGQGINFTGGGGGNGKYSGGGGGSNRGNGGDGLSLSEKNINPGACSPPFNGAFGGTTVKAPVIISNGLFLGGGGGSSTHALGSSGSSGGNGGGIVIIIADTISGNGSSIKANGAAALNASGDGGAGGGGGGGSIVLSTHSFSNVSDLLTLSVIGGNGGTNPAGFGDGGGGGAGLIWVSKISIPSNVPVNINYGIPGPAILADGNGQTKFSFIPTLNGFLFNSIRSQVTGNQIDSICSNVSFVEISGTKPVGGTPPHTYLWQKSTSSEFAGYTDAAGTNNAQNYSPGILTQTTWFRRVVRDNAAVLTDTSKAVKIVVHQSIKNNIVGLSDTICYGQDPQNLTSQAILADGNGIYSFKWQVSLNNSLFASPSGNTGESYTPPPALKATSWYRRTVTSGRCVDSTAIVKITVLDTISNNNIISLPQDICFGSTFSNLAATKATTTPALKGGDNIYRYRWESNINGSGWNTAPGKSDTAGYNPPEFIQRFPMNEYYFRRVVISGNHDVCTKTSAPVLLRDYPVITNTNNSITGKATVCYNTIPTLLTGSDPSGGGGAGPYSYLWEQSLDGTSWVPAALVNTNRDYQPPVLLVPMKYRRTAKSGTPTCCLDVSLVFNMSIDPLPTGSITSLTDTILCEGSGVRLKLHLTGASPWQVIYKENAASVTVSNISGPDPVLLAMPATPTALTTFNYSLYEVKDQNNCIATSLTGTRKAIVYKMPKANAGPDAEICGPKFNLNAVPSAGTGTWYYPSAAVITSPNNPTATVTIDSIFAGANITHKFIWEEVNWQCKSKDSVNVTFDKRVTAINAGKDTVLYSFDNIFRMSAQKPVKWEIGKWSVISGTGDFSSDSATLAEVENMSKGLNTYLWTVHNGTCKNEDLVNVNVYQLVIPEGFSPNNDAFNNTFIITGLDLPNQEAELKIINGAGAEVFSTFKTDNVITWKDWDGKNSGGIDLPEGTYYYLLKITSKRNGQVFRKSGFIVLKRY